MDVIDQFYDGSLRDYVLRALDSQDVELFEKPYMATSFSLFQPLADWVELSDGNEPWSDIGTSTPSVALATSTVSNRIKSVVDLVAGKTYRVVYTVTKASGGDVDLTLRFRNAGIDVTPLPSVITISTDAAPTSGFFDIVLDSDADDFTLLGEVGFVGSTNLTINSFVLYDIENANTNVVYSLTFNPDDEGICKKLVKFELWDVTDAEEVRISRTDLMDFKESDCISAWDYTSTQNYAGLLYLLPEGEEAPIFRLCIEGVFAHERELTEDVVVELTEQTIGTATSLKKQKLLTVQDAPDFFHRKIQLMLAHGFIGSVTDDIYNRTWVREEKYEKEIRDRRYIFKEGNVQLTDINYLKRGVI